MRARCGAVLVLACVVSACGQRIDLNDPFRKSGWTGVNAGKLEAPTPACATAGGCHGPPERTGTFDVGVLPEASGLAASRLDPELLWLVDDRPGTDTLWAVRTDGRTVAGVRVPGLDAVNVESLAAGPCGRGGAPACLYVADVGDNARGRESVRILRVAEPDLSGDVPAALAAAEIVLRYPGGAQDAEALLVDGDGVPYLVSKARFDTVTGATGPTTLYGAPGFRSGLLLDLGEIALPPPETAVASLLYGNVVTGGDAAPGRVLLRTYDHAVEFLAPEPEAALAGFPAWPARVVPAPWQPQGEGAAYASEGCAYWLVSERVGDIWHVPCRE